MSARGMSADVGIAAGTYLKRVLFLCWDGKLVPLTRVGRAQEDLTIKRHTDIRSGGIRAARTKSR